MIKFFKRWEELLNKLEKLLEANSKLQKSIKKDLKLNELVTELNRKQIGSIDLSDIVEDDISESKRKNYLQKAESLWTNEVFQNEVKKIMSKQMEFAVCQTSSQDQTYIARGTINGIALIHERIEQLHSEYKELSKPMEVPGKDFDKFSAV